MRLGLDVGGTDLKMVTFDDHDRIDELGRVGVPEDGVLDFVADTAAALVTEHGVRSVGVGVAGLVRWPDGVFVWGPHVTGVEVPYRAELEHRLGLPVAVDNDANAGALAEATLGAGRGERVVLFVSLGTGIGTGLVVDGTVYRGSSFAGEAGHMIMVPDGEVCACGLRGCWETLVSGAAFDRVAADLAADDPTGPVARAAAVDGVAVSGPHLASAARAGDGAARAALADAGTWLGRGVVNLVAMLDPDVVVIGGAAAAAGRWVLDPAGEAVGSLLSGAAHRRPVRLVPGELGSSAGAVGAALLSI